MLRPRVMPCLLLSETGLVKTRRYGNPYYLGDPLNVINIFNRLDVDELILLDIDASVSGRPPRFDVVKEVAGHCTAPLTYGGGISQLDERSLRDIGISRGELATAAWRDSARSPFP